MIKFDIITIFPHILDSYLDESILGRAQKKKKIRITTHDLRAFTKDKHRTVDDTPYGGGPGMVIKLEPVYKAVQALKPKTKNQKQKTCSRVILFSTRGKTFDTKVAKRLAKYDQLILICGRYEGVDERVAQHIADEEISIGKFVLSGGELPALVVTEAVARFIPGVLGKQESLEEVKGSYPVFTKPETFESFRKTKKGTKGKRTWTVPKVLLSGNHKEIDSWRKSRGKGKRGA